MGINTDSTMALGWGLGLACTGMAGALLVNFNYVYPQVGALFGMLSYMIVALGGFGSLVGAFVAGILVGLVEAVGGFLVAPAFKYALVFSMYLLVVLCVPVGSLASSNSQSPQRRFPRPRGFPRGREVYRARDVQGRESQEEFWRMATGTAIDIDVVRAGGRRTWAKWGGLALLGAAVLVYPFVFTDPFPRQSMILVFLNALLARMEYPGRLHGPGVPGPRGVFRRGGLRIGRVLKAGDLLIWPSGPEWAAVYFPS